MPDWFPWDKPPSSDWHRLYRDLARKVSNDRDPALDPAARAQLAWALLERAAQGACTPDCTAGDTRLAMRASLAAALILLREMIPDCPEHLTPLSRLFDALGDLDRGQQAQFLTPKGRRRGSTSDQITFRRWAVRAGMLLELGGQRPGDVRSSLVERIGGSARSINLTLTVRTMRSWTANYKRRAECHNPKTDDGEGLSHALWEMRVGRRVDDEVCPARLNSDQREWALSGVGQSRLAAIQTTKAAVCREMAEGVIENLSMLRFTALE